MGKGADQVSSVVFDDIRYDDWVGPDGVVYRANGFIDANGDMHYDPIKNATPSTRTRTTSQGSRSRISWPEAVDIFRNNPEEKAFRKKFIFLAPKLLAMVAPATTVDNLIPLVGQLDDVATIPLAYVSSSAFTVFCGLAAARIVWIKFKRKL